MLACALANRRSSCDDGTRCDAVIPASGQHHSIINCELSTMNQAAIEEMVQILAGIPADFRGLLPKCLGRAYRGTLPIRNSPTGVPCSQETHDRRQWTRWCKFWLAFRQPSNGSCSRSWSWASPFPKSETTLHTVEFEGLDVCSGFRQDPEG